jgi:lysine 2,3-aminomutase
MSNTITNERAREVRPADWDDWRWQTRHRLRSLREVLDALELPEAMLPPGEDVLRRFPIGVTPYYLALARIGDPTDPIVRQVVPVAAESDAVGQEVADPFREDEHSPVPGVVHRYADRALVLPTNFCATLCRHCFRKRSWADGFYFLDRVALARAVDYVRANPGIRDVLVTGGDPLHLAPRVLGELLADLRSIERLDVIRVASRIPATLPQRIDDEMLAALTAAKPLWFITHFNCAAEVSAAAAVALRKLIDHGITVQNQTVLLRGVNDSLAAQLDLARALIRQGVRPYYLHLADPVAGAGHFRTPLRTGLEILAGMQGKVAGFAIPKLVLDLPGGKGKVPISPDFRTGSDDGLHRFRSPIDGSEVEWVEPL